MPKITSHKLTSGDYEYDLSIDFKDIAIMENRVEFEVSARRRHLSEDRWQQESVTLRFDFERKEASVLFHDAEIGKILLSDLNIEPETPAEVAWSIIAEAWTGTPIEELIHMIPADPVFGCLIKAGISTTVGQTLRCYNQVLNAESFVDHIRKTLLCLGQSTLNMVLTATARTLRCIVLVGLG